MSGTRVTITYQVKGNSPLLGELPFTALKNRVLGKKYDLSLVFVDRKLSQKLNQTYRKKDKPANVLAFALSKTKGEMVICPAEARVKAPYFSMNQKSFFKFLFIHGLLHLKGRQHGSTMEREEQRLLKTFGSSASSH